MKRGLLLAPKNNSKSYLQGSHPYQLFSTLQSGKRQDYLEYFTYQ